jgi:hypothetical protein
VAPPGVSLCSGGRYQRASDPWVDFSPNGTAYFMSLVTDNDPPSGSFGKNGMVVNRSTDGGATWSRAIQLSALPVGQSLDDKNSLTADPTNSNFAYAVWDRLMDFSLPPELRGGGAAGARARAKFLGNRAGQAGAAAKEDDDIPVFFKGSTYLSRTTNGGRTWEAPRKIYDPGDNQQTINNLIVVQPNGTLFNFFSHIYPTGEVNIEVIRSSDKGRTWERRPTIVANVFTVGTVTPDEGAPVRDASILFDVAIDSNNGSLHVVWQDARFGAGLADQIACTTSTNAGRQWSRPAWVNLTPLAPSLRRRQAFVPSVEVGPGGVLVVTHYDFRNDNDGAAELTDHWAVLCDSRREDCRDAFMWDTEARLTPRSFDMLDAPIARGHFLGDYVGLARAGNAVYPVWSAATANDVTNLFTRKLTLSGGAVASDAAAAATVAAKKAAAEAAA